MTRFRPVKPTRVSDEVAEQIKQSILLGDFKEGDKLPSEHELMDQFQVSRATIREALRSLKNSGFLATRQGASGGAYVKELSFEGLANTFLDLFLVNKINMPELCRAREVIEPEVARLAAINISPEYAARLLKALEAEELPVRTILADIESKTRVHFILAEMCGNRFIEAIVTSLLEVTRNVVAAAHGNTASLHPAGMHRPVVEAVLAGEPDEAAQAMRLHAIEFSEILIDMEKQFRMSMGPGFIMKIPSQPVSPGRKKMMK
jgi:GntR family transcriptional regulator, transcriptional repressor for pyruvate dehydrogenase complex